MTMKFIHHTILCLCIASVAWSQQKLIISMDGDNVVNSVVDSTIHQDYGLSYPLTYELSVSYSEGLTAQKRHSTAETWSTIDEKLPEDFYNGIEAVRFDVETEMAYVSVAFANESDSLFLRILNSDGTNALISFYGISKYYDNRTATVTCSADDWADWFDDYFPYAVSVFRDHNLWLSVGIISEGCNASTWQHIQEQLDLGMVEAASHSRNHPHAPYGDADYEVSGSKADIIENLDLPANFRKGDQEYVYLWIAPYGEYDDQIDALVASNKYLVSRMYTSGDYSFPTWVEDRSFYGSTGMSREVGPFWEGTTDLEDLNGSFDTAYEMNGIYHLMCHPHVLSQENIWGFDYIWSHLEYVSNREDIWYASVGQVYMYHLMQDQNSFNTLNISENIETPSGFTLEQNFPNPFNPSTSINYSMEEPGEIRITIFNVRGQKIQTLFNSYQTSGMHTVTWDGLNKFGNPAPGGVYLYKLSIGQAELGKKMLLLR
jgi:hypothetical protein